MELSEDYLNTLAQLAAEGDPSAAKEFNKYANKTGLFQRDMVLNMLGMANRRGGLLDYSGGRKLGTGQAIALGLSGGLQSYLQTKQQQEYAERLLDYMGRAKKQKRAEAIEDYRTKKSIDKEYAVERPDRHLVKANVGGKAQYKFVSPEDLEKGSVVPWDEGNEKHYTSVTAINTKTGDVEYLPVAEGQGLPPGYKPYVAGLDNRDIDTEIKQLHDSIQRMGEDGQKKQVESFIKRNKLSGKFSPTPTTWTKSIKEQVGKNVLGEPVYQERYVEIPGYMVGDKEEIAGQAASPGAAAPPPSASNGAVDQPPAWAKQVAEDVYEGVNPETGKPQRFRYIK